MLSSLALLSRRISVEMTRTSTTSKSRMCRIFLWRAVFNSPTHSNPICESCLRRIDGQTIEPLRSKSTEQSRSILLVNPTSRCNNNHLLTTNKLTRATAVPSCLLHTIQEAVKIGKPPMSEDPRLAARQLPKRPGKLLRRRPREV
jgi:hypothetical protein